MVGRAINKLSARRVETVAIAGRYSDGGGLYLAIDEGGRRRWLFIYRRKGRRREMGLGSANKVGGISLERARKLAAAARDTLAAGQDPIDARKSSDKVPTFGEMADQLIASMEPSWRNEKHAAQWKMTLAEHAKPLRGKPVNEITVEDVLAVLKPLWQTVPETAGRLRGRIERVLNAAKAQGYRTGENPAAWRGHLENLLPTRQKLTRGHHAAMPFDDVPAFLTALRQHDTIAARALEFTILTAARSGEALGARWEEIDFDAALWTIPAPRMKAGKEHCVPLVDRAVEILDEMRMLRVGEYVFPGQRQRGQRREQLKPLSGMAMAMLLRRLQIEDATVHGFRSSFRDWAGECTSFPRELAEAALAHAVGDKVERAYRRGDALARRRELMSAWAAFCAGESAGNVVALAPVASIRSK